MEKVSLLLYFARPTAAEYAMLVELLLLLTLLLAWAVIRDRKPAKMPPGNAISSSPKIYELIALIQVENFDVIALNETWLDAQNKHLLAEVALHSCKVFHVGKPTPTRRGGRSITHVKNKLNPIEIKLSATCKGKLFKLTSTPRMQYT